MQPLPIITQSTAELHPCAQLAACLTWTLTCVVLWQSLNGSVMAEGARKVDVLKATKDFKKGIYGLQWEHTYANKEVSIN